MPEKYNPPPRRVGFAPTEQPRPDAVLGVSLDAQSHRVCKWAVAAVAENGVRQCDRNMKAKLKFNAAPETQ